MCVFCSVVLKPFFRVTRRVDELSVAFQPLFQKYCEALADQSVVPDESMKRRLFDNLQPYLTVSLNDVVMISSWPSDQIMQEGDIRRKGFRKSLRKEASNELDFHMSMSAKYLLLSAFIASRNPATLDAALFDSSGVSSNSKQKKYWLHNFSIHIHLLLLVDNSNNRVQCFIVLKLLSIFFLFF